MRRRRNEVAASDGSESSSLEEISSDDFRSRSRVWMGYPSVPRSFGQDLVSFAWAQAIQNKPLGFDVKPAEEEEELVYEVDDEEQKEGELEEGEIELGSEPATEANAINADASMSEKKEDDEEEDVVGNGEFDQRVGLILEELETITVEVTELDFNEVCSRLQKSYANLKQMFSESAGVPVLDALVQQAFMGIQTVYGVSNSGNLKKEQNRELLLRSLVHIKNQYSVLLTAEQVKEIDERVQILASESVHVEKPGNVGKLNGSFGQSNNVGLDYRADYRALNRVSSNNTRVDLPKLEQPTILRKVDFSPLLNLHADYDEDSLPSPTRDNTPPLPTLKPIGFGSGMIVPPTQSIPTKNAAVRNGTLHPYVADAFKEVSSYQQKYGRNSIHASTQLPSPTPSEDGNDSPDDCQDEVSSSSVGNSVRTVGFSSDAANANSLSRSKFAPVKPVGQMGLGPNPVVKAPAKSRDPRLRFMNPEVGVAPQNGLVGGSVNSRKNKAVDEPLPDENTMKRQRNGPSRDVQATTGSGGWIENGGPLASQMDNNVTPNENVAMEIRKPGNGVNATINSNGSMPNPATSSVPAVSLPSLLKDIALNPAKLLQLLKEQQRLAAEVQQKTANPKLASETQQKSGNLAVNELPGVVPSINDALTKPVEVVHNPAMKPQMTPQDFSMIS